MRGTGIALAIVLLCSQAATAQQIDLEAALDGVETPERTVRARCKQLFTRAANLLAAERYPEMLRVANEGGERCPGPRSAYMLGLAKANLVDKHIVTDPAQREKLRQEALNSLRAAVAGGGHGLRSEWVLSVHDWIRELEKMGPSVDINAEDIEAAEKTARDPEGVFAPSPAENVSAPMQKAPPPPPEPAFPWGPLVVGSAGLIAVSAGIWTGLEANAARGEAAETREALTLMADALTVEELETWIGRVNDTESEAESFETWTLGLLIGGGTAVVGSVLWYALLPPEGKWSWAMTPSGMMVTGRF